MAKDYYEIIEGQKPEFEPVDLIRVRSGSDELIVRRFGSNTYDRNLSEMARNYSCLPDYPLITFTPATTEQSVLVASVDFENRVKQQIFDLNYWLQAGHLIGTKTRIFANPLRNPDGSYIMDEDELIAKIGDTQESDGVFFNEQGLGYCLRSSFETGIQDSEIFSKGGLARLLEGARGKVAKKLKKISSFDNYKPGVNVGDFEFVKEPVIRIAAGLRSRGGRLDVFGCDWGDNGFAFGVLKDAEA